MKTKFFMLALVLWVTPTLFAQVKPSSAITMKPGGLGQVAVSKGRLRRLIGLKKDIAGCSYVPKEFKKSLDQKGCAASPAQFKLIDARTKDKVDYLLISAEAMGGCNVCGRCGAAESFTLVWLALDSELKEISRKVVVIEDCNENIELISPTFDFVEGGDQVFAMKFDGDKLRVEYEKTIFGDDDKGGFEYSTAEYDRAQPELGLVLKTEKRKESSSK